MPKYIVYYSLKGEIVVEADSLDNATQKFYDRVGFSEDDIYENAINEVVNYVEEE